MRRTIIAMAGLALAATPVTAQETRVGEAGFESPRATLADMDWLVGQWTGTGIGGAPATESWLSPTGGTMVGSFVQQNGEGGISFTEHMYLMEQGGTLVLQLKHFNADLTGWEEKGDMLTFRLVAIEPCAAYFSGLTLRCTIPGAPSAGLVAAVRMKGGTELSFRFRRADQRLAKSCDGMGVSVTGNTCFADVLRRADERRATYLAAALRRYASYPKLTEMIAESEAAFIAYRDANCDANAEWYKQDEDQSPAIFMELTCATDLTDQRTHEIWENWLTYMDESPPILPEPGRTD